MRPKLGVVLIGRKANFREEGLARALMSLDMNQTHILTLKEAAKFLRVKPITIRRLILRKKLKRIPYVKTILIPLSSILRLVEAAQ